MYRIKNFFLFDFLYCISFPLLLYVEVFSFFHLTSFIVSSSFIACDPLFSSFPSHSSRYFTFLHLFIHLPASFTFQLILINPLSSFFTLHYPHPSPILPPFLPLTSPYHHHPSLRVRNGGKGSHAFHPHPSLVSSSFSLSLPLSRPSPTTLPLLPLSIPSTSPHIQSPDAIFSPS